MNSYEQAVLDLAGPVPASFATFYPGPNRALVNILRACASGEFSLASPAPDAAAAAAPDTPSPNGENPSLTTAPWIYLIGTPGSGRSHLLLASCQAARNCGRDALYLSLSRPPPHLAPNLPDMEHVALVALDDIDQVAGQPHWEEGLFHFLNRARTSGTWVLMSASLSPEEASFSLPDLRSRLNWGQRQRLKPLSDDDLAEVLRIHSQARGLPPLDDKLLRYLLSHCERRCTSLLQALEQWQQAAFAAKRKPSLNLLASLLQTNRSEKSASTTPDSVPDSASNCAPNSAATESNAIEAQETSPSAHASASTQTSAQQDSNAMTKPATTELPAAAWAHPEYLASAAAQADASPGPAMPWEADPGAASASAPWEDAPSSTREPDRD